jgi:hypothetical protein
MKRFIILFVVLFCFGQAFAADTTNCAVSFDETDYSLMYYGTLVFGAAGGTDNTTTQWMRIDGLDFENYLGNVQFKAVDITGTEDFNGYIEFCDNTTGADFGALATDADLDAMAITTVTDTVGIALGTRTFGHKYMRIKLDGQTGNPNELDVKWYIFLPKKITTKRIGSVGDTL